MRFKRYVFSIAVTVYIILHFPLILKANLNVTAHYLLSSVDSVALTFASDAELLLMNSTTVEAIRKLRRNSMAISMKSLQEPCCK